MEKKDSMLEAYVAWAASMSGWRVMLTLTYEKVDVSLERCKFDWGMLVRVLNGSLFGKHYVRVVGHSYFSYLVCAERQRRGALHLHAVVDDRIDLELLHRYWNSFGGFAWARPVENSGAAVEYVVKYITKGDSGVSEWVGMFKASEVLKRPKFVPGWYMGGLRTADAL